jgi:hypothetical protein
MTRPYAIMCPKGHGEYESELCDGECPSCADSQPELPLPEGGEWVYTDELNGGRQIDAEEAIAFLLFQHDNNSEEDAADLSRAILQQVLLEFRPDLLTYENGRRHSS